MALAEELFEKFRTLEDLNELIGQPEDSHLDVKRWPDNGSNDNEAQKMLAKALCGLTNSDGGILILGMKADSKPKDEPDVISGFVPVNDVSHIASRVLNLVGQLVEPGIVGLKTREIQTDAAPNKGVVVIYVPKSDGNPARSRKDWRFYQRIGSSTLLMEYGQIEDRFGRRPHPRLVATVIDQGPRVALYSHTILERIFAVSIRNDGRGTARFPAFRYSRSSNLIPINQIGADPPIWSIGNADTAWQSFRGSANDVIHSGESLLIASLKQPEKQVSSSAMNSLNIGAMDRHWFFPEVTIDTEVLADETAPFEQKFRFPSISYIPSL